MSEATDRLVDLAGKIHVRSYRRRSSLGNIVTVQDYMRSPSKMSNQELQHEFEMLTKGQHELTPTQAGNRLHLVTTELRRRSHPDFSALSDKELEAQAREIGMRASHLGWSLDDKAQALEVNRQTGLRGMDKLLSVSPEVRKGFQDYMQHRKMTVPEGERSPEYLKGFNMAEDPLDEGGKRSEMPWDERKNGAGYSTGGGAIGALLKRGGPKTPAKFLSKSPKASSGPSPALESKAPIVEKYLRNDLGPRSLGDPLAPSVAKGVAGKYTVLPGKDKSKATKKDLNNFLKSGLGNNSIGNDSLAEHVADEITDKFTLKPKMLSAMPIAQVPIETVKQWNSSDAVDRERGVNLPVHTLLDKKRKRQYYPDLVADVRKNGITEPIIRSQGLIVDGHTRLAAAEDAGLTEVPVRTMTRSQFQRYRDEGHPDITLLYEGKHPVDKLLSDGPSKLLNSTNGFTGYTKAQKKAKEAARLAFLEREDHVIAEMPLSEFLALVKQGTLPLRNGQQVLLPPRDDEELQWYIDKWNRLRKEFGLE